MLCADKAQRLLYLRSSFFIIIFFIFFILVESASATISAKEGEKEASLKTLEDQKALTAKMIEKLRDQSVERLLKLKIGLPSTSSFHSDSSEEDAAIFENEDDDDEEENDQNVNGNASLETPTTAATTLENGMTPLNSLEENSSASSSSTSKDSKALRGRRSLRHHRRRRKGCPIVHGKTQFLCPTRNSNRYDVCITREQLCNHIHDCPDGEDEDVTHCMFYQPIDDQLKTLSHAVLLLVDNVMGREQPKSEL